MISVDTLAQYQRDVRALREQVQEADPTRQYLVETNLPLVIALARRYEGMGVDLLDLIQEGNLGLLHAARKYDPSLGAKFSTYAVFWIKEAILSARAQRIVSVSASKYTFERLQRLLHIQREIQEKTGQAPTLAELAHEMETSVATVLALLTLQQGTVRRVWTRRQESTKRTRWRISWKPTRNRGRSISRFCTIGMSICGVCSCC